MNHQKPFDIALERWLDDGPTIAPSGLGQEVQDQLSGRHQDRRLFRSTRRLLMNTRIAQAAAAVVAVLAIAGGAYWLGGQGSPSQVGANGSPSTQATFSAEATTSCPPTAGGPCSVPSQLPTPVLTIGLCLPSDVSARITTWDGATGHRIATVELRNDGSSACLWPTLDQPQLVDGTGAILINGAVAAAGDTLNLAPGDVVTTLVQDANYCRPAPIGPVTVAFVMPGGTGRVVAAPVSATDSDGVPPCTGAAGSAGDIEMHPWSR
ncbi:MAG: hypothetical protein ABI573_07860 [Chloroflexota bacterium]